VKNTLSPIAGEIRDAAETGALVDLLQHAPQDRMLRAMELAQILIERPRQSRARLRAVRIRGAEVVGELDLAGVELQCPLELIECKFTEPLNLREASAKSVRFRSSLLPGLDGRQLATHGDLELADGTQATGEVNLFCARIGGSLDCTGGRFTNPKGTAINADGIQVGNDVRFGGSYEAKGEVRLVGANVTGQVDCSGGKFRNRRGNALIADGMKVGQDVFLRDGFIAEGQVRLAGAHVVGQLDCGNGKFRNSGGVAITGDSLRVDRDMFLRNGFEADGEVRLLGAHVGGQLGCGGGKFQNAEGTAIHADMLKVDGDLFLRGGFEAKGEVRLLGAHIAGQLDCAGGNFHSAKGPALNAAAFRVEQDLFLRHGFHAEGEVRLRGAFIGGQIDGTGGRLRNATGKALNANALLVIGNVLLRTEFDAEGEVNLSGAQIRGQLDCTGSTLRNLTGLAMNLERLDVVDFVLRPSILIGGLDLTKARIGTFTDNKATWPPVGAIRLVGLQYGSIDADPAVTWRERLDWLSRNAGGYYPQPFEQLAAAYRAAGQEGNSVQIAIANQRQRRRQLNPLGKVLNLVFDTLVGYGYRTERALLWLAILISLGAITFSVLDALGFLTAANKPPAQPEFNAFMYAVDWIVPILSLHQREAWIAHGPAAWLTLAFAASGWVLTTAVVLAVTGVLKRDSEPT
jgi:hypothetical protein